MKCIGVDVGGTFADLILVDDESGRISVGKVPSTPDDPARAVVAGVHQICSKPGVALVGSGISSTAQRWRPTSHSPTAEPRWG